MARRKSDDDRLADLLALGDEFDSAQAADVLRSALSARSNHVVARAAEKIGESGRSEFMPELLTCYERLLNDPLKSDPTCAGKTAVAEALVQLEHDEFAFFEAGIKYRQIEPAWGEPEDTAANLRGICAVGMVGTAPAYKVLNYLAELLVDPCIVSRSGAARAIGQLPCAEGEALLRHKILIGDARPEVIGECCVAMLTVAGEGAIEFVGRLLNSRDDELCAEAALALGESRMAPALEPLRDCWIKKRGTPAAATLLTCISLLRSPEANQFLLELIRDDTPAAADALRSLAWYRDVPDIWKQVEAAVEASNNGELQELFRRGV